MKKQRNRLDAVVIDTNGRNRDTYVVRRASLPERFVGQLYRVADKLGGGWRVAENDETIHVGSTVESEPMREMFGIQAKDS